MMESEILQIALLFLVGIGAGFVQMVGDFVGRLVFDKLNSVKLKRIIYVGMIISGILMIL